MLGVKAACPKNSCNCLKNDRRPTSVTGKVKLLNSKIVNPRRVVPSRKLLETTSQGVSSRSTGKISGKPVKMTKKTTKSDACFVDSRPKEPIDHCKHCGDVPPLTQLYSDTIFSNVLTSRSPKETMQYEFIKGKNTYVNDNISKSLQQCFKNENFHQASDSLYNISRTLPPLCSIAEMSEKHTSIDAKTNESDISNDNTNSTFEGIEELNEFRRNNFFECHSAKSRVQHKGSVLSLQEHKCVYRFYLNERLFPTPLSSDHIGTIRCIECHLPLRYDNSEESQKINGTIQTKVKLGRDKVQDVILMLPVKEPLIVKERKRIVRQEDDEVLYFGLVTLSSTGNSVFKQNIPNDSLALRYQKGYKECCEDSYNYEYCTDTNDVVII